ncbi:MAG: phosphoribosylformylglycinamidine synthase subunit PurS [Acidimicrobiales bacterium]
MGACCSRCSWKCPFEKGWPTRKAPPSSGRCRTSASTACEACAGKSIRFDLEAADEAAARTEVEDPCRRFLTNPVIEDATITVTAGASA